MLFRKKIERCCSYCLKGTKIDDELILCIKKGVVPCDGGCWRFSYDPTKRVPPRMKPLNTAKYDEEDYSL